MSERAEIKVERHGRWVRVWAEVEGKDVSHLSYAPQPVRVGPTATLAMAGIGGVGTEPAYRRLGLARQVYARAMEEIRQAGTGSVGLYTGTEIVAHRLYRRFGFVDVQVPQLGAKIIDPEECVVRKLSELLRGDLPAELATWRSVLRVHLPPAEPVCVQIDRTKVRLLPSPPAEVDLSLVMSGLVWLQLFGRRCDFPVEFAEAARQVQWEGGAEHWERLRGALAAQHPVLREGSL